MFSRKMDQESIHDIWLLQMFFGRNSPKTEIIWNHSFFHLGVFIIGYVSCLHRMKSPIFDFSFSISYLISFPTKFCCARDFSKTPSPTASTRRHVVYTVSRRSKLERWRVFASWCPGQQKFPATWHEGFNGFVEENDKTIPTLDIQSYLSDDDWGV